MATKRAFALARERQEPDVLWLQGQVTAAGAREIVAAADEVLATEPRGLVLDLAGVDEVSTALVAVIGTVAEHAADRGAGVVLRVPEGALDSLGGSLPRGVHVERTRLVPATRPVRRPPAARKAAPGGITSYGDGRTCGERGCHAALSRYNPNTVCFAHLAGRS